MMDYLQYEGQMAEEVVAELEAQGIDFDYCAGDEDCLPYLDIYLDGDQWGRRVEFEIEDGRLIEGFLEEACED